jgi:hypothetical protein
VRVAHIEVTVPESRGKKKVTLSTSSSFVKT